jgi:carbonic anhydrase
MTHTRLRAPLLLAALAACAAGAPAALHAAPDDHAPAASAAASARGAKPAASAPAEVPAGNGTLEGLHQKLSERLGSVRQPTDDGTLVLKVPAKPVARERPVRVAAAAPHGAKDAHAGLHWDYAGEGGPAAWGRMKPEFAKCASGTRQSPIDIRDGIPLQLEAIEFDYKPAAFAVIDNGHTVQVNVERGSSLAIGGRRYDLLQFHFHRPSEERINGRQFDMVAHLVHKDPEGRLAVVAVLLEKGGAQPVIQQVWNNLPLEKNEEQRARGSIDLNRLLPEDRRYYTYMGSLTTPPCSEGVLWMVMKQPVPVAPEQVGVFSRLYPMNARPVQPTSGRMIKEGL